MFRTVGGDTENGLVFSDAQGDVENGLVFAGARVGEIKEILPVQTIIDNLTAEYENAVKLA